MGIGEQCAAFGEAIDVRREGLRMALEAPDPVVEIIDSDEQDVGFLRQRRGAEKMSKRQERRKCMAVGVGFQGNDGDGSNVSDFAKQSSTF